MPTTATAGFGSARRRWSHQGATVRPRDWIAETCGKAADGRAEVGPLPAFAHRVGECDQVIVVRVRRQRTGVANQLPAARRGDASGVQDAQIPGMRLGHGGQWTHYRRRVGIDERQRRDRIVRAPRPAAATGNIHSERLACSAARVGADTRSQGPPDPQPLRSSS